jgi:hypothetical protein
MRVSWDRTATIVLAAALAVGCAAAPRPIAPSASHAEIDPTTALRDRARVDLGCARASLVELGEGHVAVAGCGAQREYRRVCAARGCEWFALDDLAIRASFELECPVSSLEVVTLGASSRGVIGCGMRATYVLVCQSEGCHWLPSSVHRSHLFDQPTAPASSRLP